MQQRKRLLRANRKPLDFFDQQPPTPCNQSNVLEAIKNQDLYLKIVGIALEISTQAGVSGSALQELESKLLAAKGYQEFSMLNQDKNQQMHRVEPVNKNVPFVHSKKYITPQEQLAFLAKMEKQVLEAQAKQHVIYALKKYIGQKKKTLTDDTLRTLNLTRTSAFLQKARAKSAQRKLYRANFYGQTLREIIGRIQPERTTCYETLKKITHLKTVWGHTFFSEAEEEYCPVYNVIFDASQKLVITGGEDGKIKVWSRNTGSLISTLQGHKDYINKICVSKDNKTILSAAQDGVRFFDLDNMNSLGGYKTESIMDIGEVIEKETKESFIIFANLKKLFVLPLQTVRSQQHRKIELYDFRVYNFGSRLHEGSINTTTLTITNEGMVFLGFSEGQIIIFDFNKLSEAKIDEDNYGEVEGMGRLEQFQLPITCVLNAHEGDVLEIKWNPFLSCFSTGAKKDGVCKIWQFKLDEPEKRPLVVKELKIPKYKTKRKKKMYNCNFGCWNSSLTHLTCSFEQQEEGDESENRGDGEVLVYNAMKMEVTWQMSKTIELSSIRAMDSHPFYPNVMVICDSYGKVIIADIYENCIINIFEERAFHLNHPSFCLVPSQCRFSQDGLTLLVATQYGNFSIYGYDIKEFYQIYPTQQLFQNDYEEFQIDPLTFKPVLENEAPVDFNNIDRGEIQNMRRQPYRNLNKIDGPKFKKTIDQTVLQMDHQNQYNLPEGEVEKIAESLHEYQKNMQIFKQNMEEIQNKRMTILFEERELREGKLKQIINEKLQRIKQVDQISISLLTNSISSNNGYTGGYSQNSQVEHLEGQPDQNVNQVRRRGRRPTRNLNTISNTQRRSYAQYQEASQANQDQISNEPEVENEDEQQEYEAENEIEADDLQSYEDEEDEDEYDDDNSENQSEDFYMASRSRKRRNRINRAPRNRISNFPRAQRRPAKDQIEELENGYEEAFGRLRKRQFENKDQGSEQAEQNEQQKNQMRRVASRTLNQMTREREYCNLCSFKQSTVVCHHCRVQRYCEGCKNFRGKKIPELNRYICFQCYFIKNTSTENHKNVSFEKYTMTERTDLFIPQIGDEVVYFFQGYEQFLYDKIETLNNKYIELEGTFDIVPHQNHPELINVQKCEIIKIDFAFPLEEQSQPSYKNMANRRGRVQKSSVQDILAFITLRVATGHSFKVFYSPGYQYIIRWEIYEDIIHSKCYEKFNLYDIVKIKSEQIQIEEIRPLSEMYSNSIWKNIVVHKSENKYLRTRDKSEDIAINIWNIDGIINENALKYRSTFSAASRDNYRNEIAKIQFAEPGIWEIFYEPVNVQIYDNYHNFVEVSMCLQLIIERLKNNYYACEQSFASDLQLLIGNSIIFNGKENNITAMAQRLVKIILQGEGPSNNQEQENSTEKKTKPKRKFNSGSSLNRENEDEDKGKKRAQVKVSKFTEDNEVVPSRRLKRVRYAEKDSDDDDYKQESQQNYEAEIESSEVKPVTRNRRKQESHEPKKDMASSGRVTRSRTKN